MMTLIVKGKDPLKVGQACYAHGVTPLIVTPHDKFNECIVIADTVDLVLARWFCEAWDNAPYPDGTLTFYGPARRGLAREAGL